MNGKQFLLLITFVCTNGLSHARSVAIEGVPVHLGDSVKDAQKALNTNMEPEVMPTANQFEPQKTMIRLKTKGIWVFFNKHQVVETIRLDAPFAGNIGGVTIASAQDVLVRKLGKPNFVMQTNLWQPPFPVLYFLDSDTEVRFDFNRDEEVDHVLIFRPPHP